MPRPLQIGAVLLGLIAGCWSEGGPNDDLNLGDGYCEPLNCTDLLHFYIERRDQEPFIPGDYTVEIETAQEVVTTITCTLEETDLFHLRNRDGQEVDAILERHGRVVCVEVKSSTKVDRGDARGLVWMRDRLGGAFHRGVVLYSGSLPFQLSEKVWALPLSALWRVAEGASR